MAYLYDEDNDRPIPIPELYEINIRCVIDNPKGDKMIAGLLVDVGFTIKDFTVTEKAPTTKSPHTSWNFKLKNEQKKELYSARKQQLGAKIRVLCDCGIINYADW